ncbi:type II toxin-antitoxin system VapC family toxin [Geoglobus sp.]
MFIDTNIFYNLMFETELTSKAAKILEIDERLATSFIVVNETLYILARKLAEKEFGIKSNRKFRNFISENGYEPFRKEMEMLFGLFEDLSVEILTDHQDVSEIWKIMCEYKLLPNDALIASTCRHYGIKKIATFDEDFKRVDFLEIVRA